jgi:Methyltransferase FkbM domain
LKGRTLNFVSIDVEGMEQEVLSGLDLKNFRPWIVVIEATIPGLPTALVREMATTADGAGVHDGVFRRSQPLLSRKRDGEPAPSFLTLPPNIWDDFVIAKQIVQQERIAVLEAEIDRLRRNSHQRGSMSERPT